MTVFTIVQNNKGMAPSLIGGLTVEPSLKAAFKWHPEPTTPVVGCNSLT